MINLDDQLNLVLLHSIPRYWSHKLLMLVVYSAYTVGTNYYCGTCCIGSLNLYIYFIFLKMEFFLRK